MRDLWEDALRQADFYSFPERATFCLVIFPLKHAMCRAVKTGV